MLSHWKYLPVLRVLLSTFAPISLVNSVASFFGTVKLQYKRKLSQQPYKNKIILSCTHAHDSKYNLCFQTYSTYYLPSLKERTRYSSRTRIRTVSWAVGATTKPGNQLSFCFFLSPSSTHTTFPISASFSSFLFPFLGLSSSSLLSSLINRYRKKLKNNKTWKMYSNRVTNIF